METYLGLGSNLGGRMANLRSALIALETNGLRIHRVSPVVESPAILPSDAEPGWNKPYLNIAVRAETSLRPAELLRLVKGIERELGRDSAPRWAPRPIDIDILLYEDQTIVADNLVIPHPEMHRRAFVLTPLVTLNPSLRIPGMGTRSILQLSRDLGDHIPLWMGIINLTPDSFSDGGRHETWEAVEPRVTELVNAGAHIIDLGAESTRPGATALTADQEWSRLAPVLEPLMAKYRNDVLRPRISVDTYHPEVARRALVLGVDIINDVGGLTDPRMVEAARLYDAECVAMHHVTVPADPAHTLPAEVDPLGAVEAWITAQIEQWLAAGIDLNRIYFDPGIGFGKNPLQSLAILRHMHDLRHHGLRMLVGHSRKSFMSSFAPQTDQSRDLTTIGASLNLIAQGVDVVRVHDVQAHASAYLGWAHLNS